jgi:nicotinamide-nucleotide amidase
VLAGYVTYSNEAKARMLGVAQATLADHGAVSEPVARQMAEGAQADAGADIAISCTGIAGPGGGSVAKPVGLVFIGCAARGQPTRVERHVFAGDRTTAIPSVACYVPRGKGAFPSSVMMALLMKRV